jgi:hypothetical protein
VWVKGCEGIHPAQAIRLVDELTQQYYIHDMLPDMHFEGMEKRAVIMAHSFGEVRRVLMSADFWMKCLTAHALYVAPENWKTVPWNGMPNNVPAQKQFMEKYTDKNTIQTVSWPGYMSANKRDLHAEWGKWYSDFGKSLRDAHYGQFTSRGDRGGYLIDACIRRSYQVMCADMDNPLLVMEPDYRVVAHTTAKLKGESTARFHSQNSDDNYPYLKAIREHMEDFPEHKAVFAQVRLIASLVPILETLRMYGLIPKVSIQAYPDTENKEVPPVFCQKCVSGDHLNYGGANVGGHGIMIPIPVSPENMASVIGATQETAKNSHLVLRIEVEPWAGNHWTRQIKQHIEIQRNPDTDTTRYISLFQKLWQEQDYVVRTKLAPITVAAMMGYTVVVDHYSREMKSEVEKGTLTQDKRRALLGEAVIGVLTVKIEPQIQARILKRLCNEGASLSDVTLPGYWGDKPVTPAYVAALGKVGFDVFKTLKKAYGSNRPFLQSVILPLVFSETVNQRPLRAFFEKEGSLETVNDSTTAVESRDSQKTAHQKSKQNKKTSAFKVATVSEKNPPDLQRHLDIHDLLVSDSIQKTACARGLPARPPETPPRESLFETFLDLGLRATDRDENGVVILEYPIKANQPALFQQLISRGFSPKDSDKPSGELLRWAFACDGKEMGNVVLDMIETLPPELSHWKDFWVHSSPEAMASGNIQPICYAVGHQQWSWVARLLAMGADLTMVQQPGFTALHQALCVRWEEGVPNILAHPESQTFFDDLEGKNPNRPRPGRAHGDYVSYAVNHFPEMIPLLSARYDSCDRMDTCGMSAVHHAADCNQVNTLKWLREHGWNMSQVSVDDQAPTAIFYAVVPSKIDAFRYLLSECEVPFTGSENLFGGSLLHTLVQRSNLAAIQLLWEKDPDWVKSAMLTPARGGEIPMHVAIANDFAAFFEWGYRVCPETFRQAELVLGQKGERCLHMAVAHGATGVLPYFLSAEALQLKDQEGRTPLHMAFYPYVNLMALASTVSSSLLSGVAMVAQLRNAGVLDSALQLRYLPHQYASNLAKDYCLDTIATITWPEDLQPYVKSLENYIANKFDNHIDRVAGVMAHFKPYLQKMPESARLELLTVADENACVPMTCLRESMVPMVHQSREWKSGVGAKILAMADKEAKDSLRAVLVMDVSMPTEVVDWLPEVTRPSVAVRYFQKSIRITPSLIIPVLEKNKLDVTIFNEAERRFCDAVDTFFSNQPISDESQLYALYSQAVAMTSSGQHALALRVRLALIKGIYANMQLLTEQLPITANLEGLMWPKHVTDPLGPTPGMRDTSRYHAAMQAWKKDWGGQPATLRTLGDWVSFLNHYAHITVDKYTKNSQDGAVRNTASFYGTMAKELKPFQVSMRTLKDCLKVGAVSGAREILQEAITKLSDNYRGCMENATFTDATAKLKKKQLKNLEALIHACWRLDKGIAALWNLAQSQQREMPYDVDWNALQDLLPLSSTTSDTEDKALLTRYQNYQLQLQKDFFLVTPPFKTDLKTNPLLATHVGRKDISQKGRFLKSSSEEIAAKATGSKVKTLAEHLAFAEAYATARVTKAKGQSKDIQTVVGRYHMAIYGEGPSAIPLSQLLRDISYDVIQTATARLQGEMVNINLVTNNASLDLKDPKLSRISRELLLSLNALQSQITVATPKATISRRNALIKMSDFEGVVYPEDTATTQKNCFNDPGAMLDPSMISLSQGVRTLVATAKVKLEKMGLYLRPSAAWSSEGICDRQCLLMLAHADTLRDVLINMSFDVVAFNRALLEVPNDTLKGYPEKLYGDKPVMTDEYRRRIVKISEQFQHARDTLTSGEESHQLKNLRSYVKTISMFLEAVEKSRDLPAIDDVVYKIFCEIGILLPPTVVVSSVALQSLSRMYENRPLTKGLLLDVQMAAHAAATPEVMGCMGTAFVQAKTAFVGKELMQKFCETAALWSSRLLGQSWLSHDETTKNTRLNYAMSAYHHGDALRNRLALNVVMDTGHAQSARDLQNMIDTLDNLFLDIQRGVACMQTVDGYAGVLTVSIEATAAEKAEAIRGIRVRESELAIAQK